MSPQAVSSRAGYTALTPATPALPAELPWRESTDTTDIDSDPTLGENTSRSASMMHTTREFLRTNAGLLLVVISQIFFACMNVSVKFLNGLEPPVPPLELILIRMAITYACCIAYMYWAGTADPLLGPKGVRLLLFARGFFGFFGLAGMYCSLQYLSLSTATVLTFLAPFATAVVGGLLLHETLYVREIAAGALSLLGVLLIARPPFLFGDTAAVDDDGVSSAQRMLGIGISLIGVVGSTGQYVTIRAIGQRASAMHATASFALQCVLVSVPLSIFTHTRYVLPTNPTFLLLLPAVGIFGFIGQTLLTIGLQRETAGRGSVGLYAQIVFAVLAEWTVFGTLPRGWSVVGMALVVGCAAYVAIGKMHSNEAIKAKITNKDTELEEGLLSRTSADTDDTSIGNDPEPKRPQ